VGKARVLYDKPRKVRKGNGSLTIALPRETHDLLRLEEKEEVRIIIYTNGTIEVREGDK
jgi:antitoxin component of MazEF toxin-antitoxin module